MSSPTREFFSRRRLSLPENCLLIGYLAIVTLVAFWVAVASTSDEPSFAGIWLFVVAPSAVVPLLLTSLDGTALVVAVYVVFVLELVLVWLAWSGLRARQSERARATVNA